MTKEPSSRAIEEFLSGLPECKSRGERAAAAHFIETHSDALRDYVAHKEREGRTELAEHYERVIEEHRTPPQGVCYSESLYSIRSFRPSPSVSHSLTFATEHKTARIVGWLLAALLAGIVLYTGCKAAEYATEIFGGVTEARKQAIEDVRQR
ncbi:MAG: hypothetical protein ABIF82_12395 [Planctomycetota bacterium]